MNLTVLSGVLGLVLSLGLWLILAAAKAEGAPSFADRIAPQLRAAELSADLRAHHPEADWLSMGMTADLEQAVAAGHTKNTHSATQALRHAGHLEHRLDADELQGDVRHGRDEAGDRDRERQSA